MDDQESKKQKRNAIVVSRSSGSRYRIDEDDYNAACEILPKRGNSREQAEVVWYSCYIEKVNYRIIKLVLYSKAATSLSAAVKKLEHLKQLNLSCPDIENLPHEIGTLTSLVKLVCSNCLSLKKLPDSIGDLTNLKVIDLGNTRITQLPNSVLKLKGLRCMFLNHTPMITNNPNGPTLFVWKLVEDCRCLGSIGNRVYPDNEKLLFALACNRARARTGYYTSGVNSIAPSLWPLALHIIEISFRKYSRDDVLGYFLPDYKVNERDAIYQLLVDRRELFIATLMHR